MNTATIVRLSDLRGIGALVAESESSGYRFLRRLVDEWATGINQFAKRGEALFAAVENGEIVGLCGLNADPYSAEPSIGRLRHLYVLQGSRHRGIGGQLVSRVLHAAAGTFNEVRLRTDTRAAAGFYERLGFAPISHSSSCTHVFSRPAGGRGLTRPLEPTGGDVVALSYAAQSRLGIVLWALLRILAFTVGIATAVDSPLSNPVFWILFLGGTAALMWGCWAQAKMKNYPGGMALLGLVGLIGLIALAVMPVRPPAAPTSREPAV